MDSFQSHFLLFLVGSRPGWATMSQLVTRSDGVCGNVCVGATAKLL